MHDQADELRQLVLRTAASARIPQAPSPPLIVVSGGKEGVGTTSIAVNMSVTLACQGLRAVLVDADFQSPDATTHCRLGQGDSITEVLSGHRTVHEVLQRGPAGIQVLPGSRVPEQADICTPHAQQRMLLELRRLGAHADLIVVDVGSRLDALTSRFWAAADLVALVTADDAESIMDSYAAIKLRACENQHLGTICTVVNKVSSHESAEEVHQRIDHASQRFLGVSLEVAPSVPLDDEFAVAAQQHAPLVLQAPNSVAARAFEELAEWTAAAARDSGSNQTINKQHRA